VQHDIYGSALTAQPGWSQGRPDNNASSQLIKYPGLPTERAPDAPVPVVRGYSQQPKLSQATGGIAGVMPDNSLLDKARTEGGEVRGPVDHGFLPVDLHARSERFCQNLLGGSSALTPDRSKTPATRVMLERADIGGLLMRHRPDVRCSKQRKPGWLSSRGCYVLLRG
jgi:hypothetical protein